MATLFILILVSCRSATYVTLVIGKTDAVTLPVRLSKYPGTSEGRVCAAQAALADGITVPLMLIGLFIRSAWCAACP